MRFVANVSRRAITLGGASLIALLGASAAVAQTPAPEGGPVGAQAAGAPSPAEQDAPFNIGIGDIVVTAQRESQRLQDVPIAVSAFDAEALSRQQIENALDLQLTLPNITFTKNNFTRSSFTIRGIGDLCVGGTCENATGINSNDLPLFDTRLFEVEFFDLERVEVLRGPQGTLFGRNATSGIVNIITAKPDLSGFGAAGELEYGNFESYRAKGMVNLPLTDTLGVRLAGIYISRDGYTKNVYDDTRIDDRDLYAVRGSVRWQPSTDTTVDLLGYYFREKDSRIRIQKQKCERDPTGVLGCLPNRLGNSITNNNSTFTGTLTSREYLTTQGGPAIGNLGLGSLYGTDANSGNASLPDARTISSDYTPTYFADEIQTQLRVEQDFGPVKARLSGQYQRTRIDASQDFNFGVTNTDVSRPGLNTLQAYANGAAGPGLAQVAQVAGVVIPNGPGGPYCTSLAEPSGTGAYGGNRLCSPTQQDFDRSRGQNKSYTGEAIITSQFEGAFNFLLGGIYSNYQTRNVDLYVNSFAIDYISGVLGTLTALGRQGAQAAAGQPVTFPNVYLGAPFLRNNQLRYKLESYGLFGEGYVDIADRLKITVGLRYNNDKKDVEQRLALIAFPVPYGATNIFDSPFVGSYDADPGRDGNQLTQVRDVSFGEFTGRAVVDYKITDDNLLYASYARGYKSGGVNPPLPAIFNVSESFEPEFIDAFEIGSKNIFLNGTLRLNAAAFYYKYKALQLSRIVARTSINDNVDAEIYGFELDAVIQPVRNLAVNLGFSYLKTKVSTDKFLTNPRDPSGGRSDAVIIKDITNGSNCAVVPTTAGNAAASNAFVGFVNGQINAGLVTNPATGAPLYRSGAGLRGPVAFPADSGLNGATGAFGICSALGSYVASAGPGFGGVALLNEGVAVNIHGNQLPQAPSSKASAGIQYTADIGGNGMSLVPRFDISLTGDSFGSIFNGNINRLPSYYIMNAQLQLNGGDERWYVRGFIQNIANEDAITGLYVSDQASGLYSNIFTLEPRRYGIAAGFRF